MISLVFLALVISGPGFSNFLIFQGHRSPGQAPCCIQTGSVPSFIAQELTLTQLRRKEAEGKKENVSC